MKLTFSNVTSRFNIEAALTQDICWKNAVKLPTFVGVPMMLN